MAVVRSREYTENMNNIQKQLAELDFGAMLAEAQAMTATGSQLINNYRNYCSTNPVNCAVVNSFVAEAKNQTYDNGVMTVLSKIVNFLNERQISWQIATVCEAIHNDKNPRNMLVRNAARQAEQLLEMNENDVKQYIKAGALKNVQFVEQFRNITKAVLKESMKYISEDASYSTSNPISFVYQNDEGKYFRVLNKTYLMTNDGEVTEAICNDAKFNYINSLLESNLVTFKNDELFVNYDNVEYQISEAGMCTRLTSTSELVLETATLREYNQAYLQTTTPSVRNTKAAVLESIAMLSECFDNVVHVDCATIYQTADDKFFVIEGKNKCFAQLISSNHAQSKWSINENAIDTVKFIKEHTHVNLTDKYAEKIEENVKQAEETEKQNIIECLKNNEKESVTKRIEALTEKFKNNPAMLKVLAGVAAEYSEL